jgi:hypothetical protein
MSTHYRRKRKAEREREREKRGGEGGIWMRKKQRNKELNDNTQIDG